MLKASVTQVEHIKHEPSSLPENPPRRPPRPPRSPPIAPPRDSLGGASGTLRLLVLAIGLSTTFVGGSGSLSESSSWSLPVLWLAGRVGRGRIVHTKELVKVLRDLILVNHSFI